MGTGADKKVSPTTDIQLFFHPWIRPRTILHEYYSRSWGMFIAAEQAQQSGVAATLTGLSFELAVKALLVLVNRDTRVTHKIGVCLKKIPELKSMLKTLWGSDLDFLIQFIDEDINTAQMRFGASGSNKDKSTNLIAATFAPKASIWTEDIRELYEEFMCILGMLIWENFPNETREGRPVQNKLKLTPIFLPGSPQTAYPAFDRSMYGLYLAVEVNGVEANYGAIIPVDRVQKNETYWVRVRIGRYTAVQLQVKQKNYQQSLTNIFKWIGRPVEGAHFTLYPALSTLREVRPV